MNDYTQADVDAIVAEINEAKRGLIDCDGVEVFAHDPLKRTTLLRFTGNGTDVFISVPQKAIIQALMSTMVEAIEAVLDAVAAAAVREASEA